MQAVCWYSSRLLNSPCVASSCASALLLDQRSNKERFHFSEAPPSDRAAQPNTSSENSHTEGGAEPLKITLVHKAAILNSLTGLYQEANKRLKMWHRALCVRLSKQRRIAPDKERSVKLRSYLIRHQSFPLLPTRIQVNYLDLDRICSSARKWLFSAPSEDCPFWITWYYFVAWFTGHTGIRGMVSAGPCSLLSHPFTLHGPGKTFIFYFAFV